MRRLRYCVAMSLDGFIAGPNGEADWITMDESFDFASFFTEFDTLLMGRRTFEVTHNASGPAMPGMQAIVCSRTLGDSSGVTLSRAAATVASLKSKPGKDIWLFGGGGLFRSLLDAQCVDTIATEDGRQSSAAFPRAQRNGRNGCPAILATVTLRKRPRALSITLKPGAKICESQRNSVLQPSNGATRLLWEDSAIQPNPKGVVALRRSSLSQPRWG